MRRTVARLVAALLTDVPQVCAVSGGHSQHYDAMAAEADEAKAGADAPLHSECKRCASRRAAQRALVDGLVEDVRDFWVDEVPRLCNPSPEMVRDTAALLLASGVLT